MSEFNAQERRLAAFFSKFPFIKRVIKKSYQYFNYLLYRKKYSYKSSFKLNSLPVSAGETFFGYYDNSPLSENRRYILYHHSLYLTRNLPNPAKPINVCVWDLQDEKIVYSQESTAYNWQQGSKLQWLTSNQFIYNNYSEQTGYHSVKVTVSNEGIGESIMPIPVYDCFGSQFGLSLSFERLQEHRPDYGYRNHKNDQLLPNYSEDGIFYLDLETGHVRLLLSLKDIVDFGGNIFSKNAVHKVNHIMISPDGQHFIFLHRYLIDRRRFDRLIISDVQTGAMRLLADHEMVSHCCWINNQEILGYLREHQFGDRYYKIDVQTGKKEIVGEGLIDRFGDGHPSVYDSKMIFDTYPNKARMKELFLYDMSNEKLVGLGQFFESMKYYGETRCDLHPRLSYDGKTVFFDSVHEGKRNLYWIDL